MRQALARLGPARITNMATSNFGECCRCALIAAIPQSRLRALFMEVNAHMHAQVNSLIHLERVGGRCGSKLKITEEVTSCAS